MKIAITWVGNTGKSYVIENHFSNFKHYWETAREVMSEFPEFKENQFEFQKRILMKEIERLELLKNETQDCIIDRTVFDNLLYAWYYFKYESKKYRKLSSLAKKHIDFTQIYKIYDKVYLFTTPFKTSKNFSIFDDQWFVNLFNSQIKEKFNNLVIFKNSYDFIIN